MDFCDCLFGLLPSRSRYGVMSVPLTPYIIWLIIQRAEAVSLVKVREILEAMFSARSTRDSACLVFRLLVHARLRRRLGPGGTNPIITGSSHLRPPVELKVDPISPHVEPLHHSFLTPDKMQELIEQQDGQLLTPFQFNSPSIDAVMRRGETIFFIQITHKNHLVFVLLTWIVPSEAFPLVFTQRRITRRSSFS
jgi:hypothetical protein